MQHPGLGRLEVDVYDAEHFETEARMNKADQWRAASGQRPACFGDMDHSAKVNDMGNCALYHSRCPEIVYTTMHRDTAIKLARWILATFEE